MGGCVDWDGWWLVLAWYICLLHPFISAPCNPLPRRPWPTCPAWRPPFWALGGWERMSWTRKPTSEPDSWLRPLCVLLYDWRGVCSIQ